MPTETTRKPQMNWHGPSGELVCGTDVAETLSCTQRLLDHYGWAPKTPTTEEPATKLAQADESWSVKKLLLTLIQEVTQQDDSAGPITLMHALHPSLWPTCDEDNNNRCRHDTDTFIVAERCLRTVLSTHTGQPCLSPYAWADSANRTYPQVNELLTEAIAFAREHGQKEKLT